MQMEVITEEPKGGKEHDERRSRLHSSCARCTRHIRRGTMSTTCGSCGLDDQNDRVGTRTRDKAGRERQDSSGMVVACGATNS